MGIFGFLAKGKGVEVGDGLGFGPYESSKVFENLS
jgi:hypothetical protein